MRGRRTHVKLTLALTAALLACAATTEAQGISGGVRAGVNFADLAFSSETEVTDSKNLTGFVVGAFATVPVTELFGFQPEVLFSRQGTKFSEEGQTAKIKLDYVQVPLLGRFALSKAAPAALLIGPSLGFRARGRIEVPGAPDAFAKEFEDQLARVDVGLTAGLAVEVGKHGVIDGRYTWGLLNVAKDSSDPGTAKNRVFSVTAGFRF